MEKTRGVCVCVFPRGSPHNGRIFDNIEIGNVFFSFFFFFIAGSSGHRRTRIQTKGGQRLSGFTRECFHPLPRSHDFLSAPLWFSFYSVRASLALVFGLVSKCNQERKATSPRHSDEFMSKSGCMGNGAEGKRETEWDEEVFPSEKTGRKRRHRWED